MKKCSTCKIEKELPEFYRNKNNKDGRGYVCKKCDNSRTRIEKRKGRWKLPHVKEYMGKYRKQHYIKNRELYLLKGYKEQDKHKKLIFDLTIDWMKKNITSKPCTYCESIQNIGCDRVDNNIGHTKDNVIPCCTTCNTVRNKNFTVAEMLRIGVVIKNINEERKKI